MEHFSPVKTSPKPNPHINLTGLKRILKDSAADIYNNIQKWNSIHLHGLPILKSITALKIDDAYLHSMQKLCNELEKNIDQLDEIVNNLKLVVQQIQATTSLLDSGVRPFVTWFPEQFIGVTERIYEAYKNEVTLRRKMFNSLHLYDHSRKMYYLISWTQQSLIPSNLNASLEALLNETGHR